MSVLGALSKRKVLLIVIALVVVVLLVGGFFGLRMMQERQAIAMGLIAEPEQQAEEAPKKGPRRPAGAIPAYAPLDVFTANLADKDRDRFGQVGITFEVADKQAEAMMKTFTPILRSRILIMLSSKTANELLSADGKAAFANEVLAMARTEVGRDNATKIYGVLFSNFVIQ